ncbi:MAG: hypothetical protein WCI71_15540, partial [Bacteroidota bacterium]
MTNRTLLIAFLFIVIPGGRITAQSGAGRKTVLFDQNWKFHFGHAGDPSKDFNYRVANIFSKSGKAENSAIDPKFDDTAWRTLDLPHDWAVELPFVNSPDFD